ncbi:MAG: DNA-3-methyladenine glycosylase [Streptosporangiales bacterium]|nr:DNA-3-methyladenine glycosylase [Streptosporangiales bacterium]
MSRPAGPLVPEVVGRSFFDRPAEVVAPELLGCVFTHVSAEGPVGVRLTEVEAYEGERDPASHAFRGRTARNAVMFGPPGYAYVYFTYGMHFCVNLVCLGEGTASAVLLRAGEVVEGVDLARARSRPGAPVRDLARGPARLTKALGIGRDLNGADVCGVAGPLRLYAPEPGGSATVEVGPRTGVAAAPDVPWRFALAGEPTVSPYRRHAPRNRR